MCPQQRASSAVGGREKKRITKDSFSFYLMPALSLGAGIYPSDFQKFQSQRQGCPCCEPDVQTRAASDSPFSDCMSSWQFSGSREGLLMLRQKAKNIQILSISESFTLISHGNKCLLITIWFSLTTGRKGDCHANLNNSSLCDNSISHFNIVPA